MLSATTGVAVLVLLAGSTQEAALPDVALTFVSLAGLVALVFVHRRTPTDRRPTDPHPDPP